MPEMDKGNLQIGGNALRGLLREKSGRILLCDMDGKLVHINKYFCQVLEYTQPELEGFTVFDLTHPEDVKKEMPFFRKCRSGEIATFPIEKRFLKKSGEVLWVNLTAAVIHDEDGRPYYAYGMVENITELKEAEESLRRSEQRFKDLFDSISDLVYVHDIEGNLISVNPAVCKTFGYTEEELIGRNIADFMKPEMRDLFETDYLENLKATGHFEGISSYFTRDGEKIYIEYRNSLIEEKSGETYVSGTGRDVTERVLAERKITQLQEQVIQSQKMEALGRLAGGIAHNFNNLLTAIQVNLSLILENADPEQPDYNKLKKIEQSVQDGAHLTRQLLGISKKGKYQPKPTNVNDLVKKTSDMFSHTMKEIVLHLENDHDLWPVEVDQSQIEQCLLNLYVNAWQAMPHGGELFIETRNTIFHENDYKALGLGEGHCVKISVTDNGIGMDEDTKQKIFDPFFTTKTGEGGTGLGLASVYGIVKNHNGMITVYSEPGKGTTFNIYLPTSQEGPIRKETGPPGEVSHGSGTILFVDDEAPILEAAAELIGSLGYEVLVAGSGKEALEIYESNQNKIDIVILDMVMPHIGGGEVYERLKKINPNVKVLLSSGYSPNGQAREIMDRGCDDFIQKPFNIKDLSHKIKNILDSE